MAFVSLSMLELVHSFNIKSEKSIFKVGVFRNMYLIIAFIFGTILQVSVIIIPQLAQIFKVTLLNKTQWLYTILISISPIFIVEMQKKINELGQQRILGYKTVK